jgi:hypothetical protein
MALFGEKCVRCGAQRTRETYEGLPTCERCQEELKAKVRAAGESPRACPNDAMTMTKDVVENVVIDRCPRCEGVWLDGGELELIKGAIEAGVAEEITRGLVRGLAFPM